MRDDPGGGEFGGSSRPGPPLPTGSPEIRGPERAAPAGPQFPLPGSQASAGAEVTRSLLNTGEPRPSFSSDLSGGRPGARTRFPHTHTHFHPPPAADTPSLQTGCRCNASELDRERRRQGIPESSKDSRAPLRIAIPRGKPLLTLPPDWRGRLTGKNSGQELRVSRAVV